MSDDFTEMWKNFYIDERAYGETLYKRATGELPEKNSTISFAEILKRGMYTPGDSVLDVGCAAGHMLRSLLTRLDPDIHYTGLDFNPYYLELARKAFGQRAQFVEGNAFDMPFGDKQFDITVVNLFHHFPDPLGALAEVKRVTRDICVWRTPIAPVTHIVKVLQSEIRGGNKYYYFNLFSEKYIRDMLKGLGIDQVSFEADTVATEFSNLDSFGESAARQVGSQ